MKYLLILCLGILLLPFVSFAQSTNEECLACHSDKSMTMEKKGKTVSIFADEAELKASVHASLPCVQCHAGFDANAMPHKEKIEPVACTSCHKKDIPKHSFHKTMLTESPNPNNLCKDCHGTHAVTSPRKSGSRKASTASLENCTSCHREVFELYVRSTHYKKAVAGDALAPQCINCHSKAITLSSAHSDTLAMKKTQADVCITCHTSVASKGQSNVSSEFIQEYRQSVHGQALERGNSRAANCVNCHGSHGAIVASDPLSPMNKKNIPSTCGKCHPDVERQYRKSIHGLALAKGSTNTPVCTDCHGEHQLLGPNDPRSRVSKLHVSTEVCSPCHNSLQLNEKFGIAANRVASYNDSFHGLANQAGSSQVANCASCHGIHNILPSSDPESPISKANIAGTCGKCHPGANDRFANAPIHSLPLVEKNDLLYYISSAYILMIISIIGGMLLHNVIDFYRKSKRKLMIRRGLIHEEHMGRGLYVRMTLSERLQHGAFLVSFITLVITGFMLRFPDAWWVAGLRSLSESTFDWRGIIHRVAAVTMLLASAYHLYYILFDTRGKQLIRDLLPRWQDAVDAIGIAKYNLGFSPDRPRLDRFSYVEKAEYWALIWGTMVMAVTGFILWFDNQFLGIVGKLGWDIAHAIHYYEAWLATLAIIVWHFYFVIFNPDTYPMNLAWLKGTITEHEMYEEHPLELERMKQEERERREAEEQARRDAREKNNGAQ